MHKLYVIQYGNGLYESKRGFTDDLQKAKLFDSMELAIDRAKTVLRAPKAYPEVAGRLYIITEVRITEVK